MPGSGVSNGLFWKGLFKAIDKFAKKDKFLLGIGKPTELSLQLLDRYPAINSFFDAMDDFPSFLSRNLKGSDGEAGTEVADSSF